MIDILKEALIRGNPVIDNTKDEAYYRKQRLERDVENISKHQFVENVKQDGVSLDPETGKVSRRFSFDLVMFQQESGLYENHEELDRLIKQRLSEQLLEIATIR